MSEDLSEDLSGIDSATEPTAESRPRPTPTGRARRAAAAAVGTEVRRPSPSPRPSPGAPNSTAPKPAENGAGTGTGIATEPGRAAKIGRAKPGLTKEGRTNPDLTKPDLTKPDLTKPDLTKPDLAKPDLAKPGRTKPDLAKEDRGAKPEPATEGRAPLWLALLLGVLVLAGVAALVVAIALPRNSGTTSERDQALAAAKSEVPVILSYDYKSFDAGLAKSKAALTGRAVTDYTKAMTTSIKPNAVKVKAVVQASTDGAGIESVSPDGKQVTVVVFGEQKVTNSTLSAPRTDIFRVRATLTLVGGHWLVSKFDQI